MSDKEPVDGREDQGPSTDERLPWSSPTLTDLGAVREVTKGISYTPLDGISNLTP